MLNRSKIEERLINVDPQLCVAFAARCSLRVLPLLVAQKEKTGFWYWDRHSQRKNILALLVAQQKSITASAFFKGSGRTLEDARKVDHIVNTTQRVFAPYTTAVHAREAAINVSKSIAYTAYAAYAVHKGSNYVSYASEAVYSAISADIRAKHASFSYEVSFSNKQRIALELDWISQNIFIDQTILSTDLLYVPLWDDSLGTGWEHLCFHFYQALLDLDSGFEPWIDWYKDRVAGKPLDIDLEEKWSNIPPEIKKQGVKATNNYLANLVDNQRKKILQPLNLVRAIFIGNGAAGKTSLIRKLHYEPVVEGKEEMTPGIDIREWSLPESDIKAKFWDFGGQVMSHSTHQFFLRERCLYILVLDARTEFNANDQAEYWLEHVKAFGNNAPVMLVGNKSDLTAVNLDMNALQEKYQNIVGFYPVSCTNSNAHFTRRFNLFHDDLVEQLTFVGTHQVMFTKDQFKVLNEVRKLSRKNAFLDYEKFNDLCKKHKIGKKGLSQKDFLGVLDSLGEIIHFPNLDWAEAYVLNPRWLTYGVYTLLYSDKADKQQGVLSEADVVEILHPKVVKDENGNKLKFPKNKCRFIVDAMSNFKLCYRLPENDKYFVIPDKLPTEQPKLKQYFDKSKEGTLTFEFNFNREA